MKISTIMFGIFLFAAVFGGFYNLASSLGAEHAYNVTIDETYKTTFDQTGEISGNLSSTYDRIRNLSTEKGTNINIITLVPDMLSIIKDMIVWPFSAVSAILAGLNDLFGIPDWVQNIVISLFTLTLIIAFAAIVLRFTDI